MNTTNANLVEYLIAANALHQKIADRFVEFVYGSIIMNDLLNVEHSLTPPLYPVHPPSRIIIAGCGGTGGWFIPKLVKILNECVTKFLILPPLEVILIDADVVENKNLLRQNFIKADIGHNKAEVMCSRYASHLVSGVTMHYIDKYISCSEIIATKSDLDKEYFIDIHETFNDAYTLFFSFIDNAVSRQIIHRYAASNRYVYLFDVANNQYNGQLTFSHYPQTGNMRADIPSPSKDRESLQNLLMRVKSIFNLGPSSFMLSYPNHFDDTEYVKLHNCADEDAEAVSQLFNANDTAASLTATVLTNCLETASVSYGNYSFFTGANISITASNPLFRINTAAQLHALYLMLEQDKSVDLVKEILAFANKYNHPLPTQALCGILTNVIGEHIAQIQS